jgi:cytidine deaminase
MQNLDNLSKKDLELVEYAKEHARKCYRKNRTSMAAALRTENGKIYTGINLKYKPVWKCMCAERNAIAKALEAGEEKFDTIVTVKYEDQDDSFSVVNICGECRQIAIFHEPLNVIVSTGDKVELVSIADTLPYSYK